MFKVKMDKSQPYMEEVDAKKKRLTLSSYVRYKILNGI